MPVVLRLGFVAGAVVGVGNERWSWCAKDVWWASVAATSGGDTNMEGSSAALASWLLGHASPQVSAGGTVMGDWLRVPHSPLAGDSLSFHLPLHRALAKSVWSICSVLVSDDVRANHPHAWWKIPVLDDDRPSSTMEQAAVAAMLPTHPLVPLIKSTLRSSNCRVVWSAGQDCSPQEAQRRRSRARNVAAKYCSSKGDSFSGRSPHSLPGCSAANRKALWARNGSSVAGMAMK